MVLYDYYGNPKYEVGLGMEYVAIIGGIILLVFASKLYQRQRERGLQERLDQAGNDPDAVMAALDVEIEIDHEREEYWRKQKPHH